uniref:Uncharacterized protein n=2 Tax=Plectus sambesii TaxID=2011161 RepID=A0A914V5N2_9BILA
MGENTNKKNIKFTKNKHEEHQRHHQYKYATCVWLPEAVAFAQQQLNPSMDADEIYDMVDDTLAQYPEEDVAEMRSQMLRPQNMYFNIFHLNVPALLRELPAATVPPAPVLPIAQGTAAAGTVAKKSSTTTRKSCRPYDDSVVIREMDDDDDQPREFRRSGSKRNSARRIGENRVRESVKRTKMSQAQTTSKSARQLVSCMVSSVFYRLREGKKAEKEKVKQEEMKSAIEYSSLFDQRSLDIVKANMSRRKATPVNANVNDDPLKAAKIMKIVPSEDAYDKAANCYISSKDKT